MKKVVVAIDFGTSGTTYAFSFSDNPKKIITGKWNMIHEKNPTEIILDEILNIKRFGAECKEYLGDQSSSKDTYYYFKDIKMQLYNNQKEIYSDNCGSKQPLTFVISKILLKIKEEALKAIRARNPLILDQEIDWKVTVPAIWKNESKDIMRKACISAQIFNNDEQSTFFALEPEAAACDYSINNPNSDAILPGKTYIICDIGGGTVDISTHKRIEENGEIYIEEMYPPIGGNNGSSFINKRFMEEVIKKLFGKKAIDRLFKKINEPSERAEIYSDYCEFLESIEEFKIKISEDKKDESRRINCIVFKEFIDENQNIDNLIEKFNKCCKKNWKIPNNNGFKIYFPYQIMIDLTKEVIVDPIIKYINRIIFDVPQIDSIIYAGTVSSNDYIISMIKADLSGYDIEHYLCTYPSIAVVEGAVIFGLNPHIIKKRISKYTIGIKCNEIWNDNRHGAHPEKKYFDEEDNCYRCCDVFSPIIEKNQKISVDEIKSRNYKIKSKKTNITFFKTLYSNVTFTDEKYLLSNKCKKFGELIFDVGDKYDKRNKDLIIELELGGTFISATIKYKKEKKKINFDFAEDI